jgi:hypothetical protein
MSPKRAKSFGRPFVFPIRPFTNGRRFARLRALPVKGGSICSSDTGQFTFSSRSRHDGFCFQRAQPPSYPVEKARLRAAGVGAGHVLGREVFSFSSPLNHGGTIEARIDLLIESKRQLADDFLAAGAEINLTEMDDRELLRLVALDLNAAITEGAAA